MGKVLKLNKEQPDDNRSAIGTLAYVLGCALAIIVIVAICAASLLITFEVLIRLVIALWLW